MYNAKNFKKENNYSKDAKRVYPNEINATLLIAVDNDDSIIANYICEVLKDTKFNKISIPIGTYRYLVDDTAVGPDKRVTTIGYIRKYDPKTYEFNIVIFNKFIDLFKNMKDRIIMPTYTTYKDKEGNDRLGTILKFIIIPESELDSVNKDAVSESDK